MMTMDTVRTAGGLESLASVKAGLAILRQHLMAQLDLVDALDAEADLVATLHALGE